MERRCGQKPGRTRIHVEAQFSSRQTDATTAKQELAEILAPTQAEDEIGRLAHFRILEVLGAGGMGIVLKAEDVQLGRIVALKLMRPSLAEGHEAKRRFRREAQAAAAFEHDHVVTIYQVEEDHGVPFFSMQWLEGESLRDRLRRESRLSIEEALRITGEIASGLAAAHRRGLLHRDIKPDNIWLCAETDRVKIVDFGLVRSLEEPSSLTHSGMTGSISARAWSADGQFLASLDEDAGAIHVWNQGKRELHRTIGESFRTAPIYAREGNYLAALFAPPDPADAEGRRTGRSPAEIHVWDVDKNQRVKKIPIGEDYIESIAWSPDGSRIAVMDRDSPTLWDVKTGGRLPLADFEFRIVTSRATSMQSWSPDSEHLLAIRNGVAVRWVTKENRRSQHATQQVAGLVTDRREDVVAVHAYYSGKLNSDGYLPSSIHLLHPDSDNLVTVPAEDIAGLKLSPDGSRVALVGPQWSAREAGLTDRLVLRVYDTKDAKLLVENEYQASPQFGVIWSPGGDKVLLRRQPNTVLVVESDTGKLLHTLEGPARPPFFYAHRGAWGPRWESPGFAIWLPDRDQFAWRAGLTSLAIVDGQSGETLRTLEAGAAELSSRNERLQTRFREPGSKSVLVRDITNAPLTASPDGRWLGAYYTDRRPAGGFLGDTIFLWDLANQE